VANDIEDRANAAMDRRSFLTSGAAVGAVAVAAMPTQPAKAADAIKWDREVDVVVIGAGAGGLVAAIAAREKGASVLIVGFPLGVHDTLHRLPVARAVWVPKPDLATAAAAWIHAGGAHHTGFSQSLTMEHLQDFADMADLELLCIDHETQLRHFRNELRWNAAAYR
jgi:L-arabinose isomerase